MKKIIAIFILTLLASAGFSSTAKATAGNFNSSRSTTTLLKRTIKIEPRRFLRYWKNPSAAEPVYDTYSWIPKVNFSILGPIAGGSKIYVEIDKPDGKSWMKIQMRTPEIEEDILENIEMDSVSDDIQEKQAILETGVFPFRIKMKNALAGTDETLFSGKFKVGTYLLDQKIPEYRNKKDFYVDYDWHLPLAYVWLNPQSNEDIPQLASQFCFRGNVDPSKLEAYLFYNGKQVAKKSATSNGLQQRMTSGADEASHRWTIWEFTFDQVRGFNKTQSSTDWSSQFFLDKNPGEYEIKVLRDNQMARSLKFSVGNDGKILDNNIAQSASLGGVRMIVPAQILGAGDGAYNKTAWQNEALFSNPLTGFSVQ